MTGKYLGHLACDDPLYYYLQHEILPQMAVAEKPARFRVFQLSGYNAVYLYEDKYTGSRVVGKFFRSDRKGLEPDKAARLLEKEFYFLKHIRDHGLTSYPHYVVRPLGRNHDLNHLLVVEYCEGELLGEAIYAAIFRGAAGHLYRKLTALAYFLATLHNRTAKGATVDFNEDCAYFDKLSTMLLGQNAISPPEAEELGRLRDQWRCQPCMWQDQQVLVHGDATPNNFILGPGLAITAVDLERAKHADRVFDVGRIAGELQHFFLQNAGSKYAAEPFIGHFLWEYACHFPDRMAAFLSITRRVPFHMGLTLLRIARNSWVSRGYRRQLINEAKNNLRGLP